MNRWTAVRPCITVETHVTCTAEGCAKRRVPVAFCGACLRNRHGEAGPPLLSLLFFPGHLYKWFQLNYISCFSST